ncbi:unnamed protein product [Peniophora sp. CBMAI 1063]|nr:unnamed protein product [Peniophora sp. CBMAI 1063]
MLQIDLRDKDAPFMRELASRSNAEQVLNIIQGISSRLSSMREGRKPTRAIRKALKPLVHNLQSILDATAETATSLGVPGGKGIFAAVAAADRVSAALDDIEKLLRRLHSYVKRLKVRVRAPLGSESRELAVMTLTKILKMLAALTRIVQRGRIQHFLYALFTKTDEVGSAFDGLEETEVEEERMAIAELVVGVEQLTSMIRSMDSAVADVSQALDVLQPTLKDVNTLARAILVETRINDAQSASALQTLLNHAGAFPPSSIAPNPPETEVAAEQSELWRMHHIVWRYLGRELRHILSRFNTQDQDLILRGVVTLFLLIIDAEGKNLALTVVNPSATPLVWARVTGTTLSTAAMFLLLFMTWKLHSVSRPIGLPSDCVIMVDVLGEAFILGPETFATWENTHRFIVNAFRGRVGLSYVQRRNYGLGDSAHLVIEPESSSQLVRPGSRLNMSVIIRERVPRCPYCEMERNGRENVLDDGRIVCSRLVCERAYGTFVSSDTKYTHEYISSNELTPDLSSYSMPSSSQEFLEAPPLMPAARSPSTQGRPRIDLEPSEDFQPGNFTTADGVHPSQSIGLADNDSSTGARGRFQRIIVETLKLGGELQVYSVDRNYTGFYVMNAGAAQGIKAGAEFLIYQSEYIYDGDEPLGISYAAIVRELETELSIYIADAASRRLPSHCFAILDHDHSPSILHPHVPSMP